jgi:glutathione peroxidase-family protein
MVFTIAFGVAWCLSPWLSFWGTFTGVSLTVMTGWFLVNSHRERRMEVALNEQAAKEELFDDRNVVLITCPCQQNTFPMQLFVNDVNEYVCDVCKNKFTINVVYDPILQTEPINTEQAYAIFQKLKEQERAEEEEKEPQ